MPRFVFISAVAAFSVLSGCSDSVKDRDRDARSAKAPPAEADSARDSRRDAPESAVYISGGTYTRGASAPGEYKREYPAHDVKLDGFFMDTTEVTNRKFKAFTEATGYVTVAERKADWDELKKQVPPGTPKPHDSLLAPGSLVFAPEYGNLVNLSDHRQWWSWKIGASWQHPSGPRSDLSGKEDHPVVHVAYQDAEAYCRAQGGRLPTEAEWEYAARGGLDGKRFPWGDEDPTEDGKIRANIWQGKFPTENKKADGYAETAPVGTYAPNGYGLYDVAGNVWEWCSDLYRADAYKRLGSLKTCINPKGPSSAYDPREPYAGAKRVIKGGSFLCHHSYCENYRPSAREGSTEDSGMPHLGFRCVYDP